MALSIRIQSLLHQVRCLGTTYNTPSFQHFDFKYENQVFVNRSISSDQQAGLLALVSEKGIRTTTDCKSLPKTEARRVNSLASLLRACGNKKALSEGRSIHDHIVKVGLQNDRFLNNLLVQMYGKCGALRDARIVFDNMKFRNHFSWNMMIGAYVQQGNLMDADALFQQMPSRDVIVWNSMMAGYVQIGRLEKALELFEQMPDRDVFSWTIVLSAHAQQGNFAEAFRLFEQMPQRNIVSWNVMISAHVQHGQLQKAIKLFQQMPERSIASWNTIIAAYVQQGNLKEAFALFQEMPQHNVVSWTAIVSAYAQQGLLEEALKLFLQMPQQDVVSFTAMISAYGQRGQLKEAIQLFHYLSAEGISPDGVTFASIIDACAETAALAEGKRWHAHTMYCKYDSDVVVRTSLVNMYAKSGSLTEARKIFNQMPVHDIFLWNTMIAAYAQYGHGKEALQILQAMKPGGIGINKITFYSVLSACNNAGFVDEGCYCFVSMNPIYRIAADFDHYNCMIDLLGRLGWLDAAEDLVFCMPYKPGVTSWTTLLSSCKTHGNSKKI